MGAPTNYPAMPVSDADYSPESIVRRKKYPIS